MICLLLLLSTAQFPPVELTLTDPDLSFPTVSLWDDGRLLSLDPMFGLFCFDGSGKTLWKRNIIGQGPEELNSPIRMKWIERGNTFFVSDGNREKALIFDADGKYIGNVHARIADLSIVTSVGKNGFLSAGKYGNLRKCFVFKPYLFRKEGSFKAKAGKPFFSCSEASVQNNPRQNVNSVGLIFEDGFILSDYMEMSIKKYSKDGIEEFTFEQDFTDIIRWSDTGLTIHQEVFHDRRKSEEWFASFSRIIHNSTFIFKGMDDNLFLVVGYTKVGGNKRSIQVNRINDGSLVFQTEVQNQIPIDYHEGNLVFLKSNGESETALNLIVHFMPINI